MQESTTPLLEMDWSTFNPWRVRGPMCHRLSGHPLLEWESLLDLGGRLEPKGQFRTHTKQATAGTPFNDAPRAYRNRRSAVETIGHLQQADAWISLLNVQTDPIYRTLVDEVLDQLKPQVERVDPGMCYRAGWIFMASPGTVTPFHFDVEHNFIFQLRGRKTLYVWDPDDTEAASEHARDMFHARHDRSLLVWREELKDRAHVFQLEPGMAAYMPSTSPHMVENGDEPSLTMSFTYYTDSTRRNRALHKLHARLRALGVTPAPVGSNRPFDALCLLLHHCKAVPSLGLKKLAGRPVYPENVAYAYTQVG
jgi:oxalate decarboxylase/phosphoglucose isomerase-like protein (cupin superfamily)